MNFISKLIVCLMTVCIACHTMAETNTAQQQPPSVKIKSYRFTGGLCYVTRSKFEPDIFTYVAAFPELVNAAKIEMCLSHLNKGKWEKATQNYFGIVNTLREARTNNMACTRVGIAQSPVMTMVKFPDYNSTNKADELEQCLYDMMRAKDFVIESQVPQRQFIPQNL